MERAEELEAPQLTPAPAIGGDLGPLIAAREPAAATPPPGTPGQPTHDFAAIVDRLVDARQAGAAVATGATIVHHEFGHVRLRLNERDGALGITLSSPDPGFVPATQAAVRAAAAASSAQPEIQAQPGPAPAGDLSPSPMQSQSASADARQPRGAPAREPSEQRTASRSAPAEIRTPAAKSGGGVYA